MWIMSRRGPTTAEAVPGPPRPPLADRLAHPRGVLVVSAAAFAAVTLLVVLGAAAEIDAAVRDVLLAWAGPGVVAAMRVVNHAGDWKVLAPGMVVLLAVFPRARRRWWIWVALMLAAPLAEGGLKELIGRPRPEGGAFGFPSGHATAAAAYFGALAYLAGALRSPGACLVVRLGGLAVVPLVGAARVVLRAHWPSDVLGGIALGLALAAAAALADATQDPGAR